MVFVGYPKLRRHVDHSLGQIGVAVLGPSQRGQTNIKTRGMGADLPHKYKLTAIFTQFSNYPSKIEVYRML